LIFLSTAWFTKSDKASVSRSGLSIEYLSDVKIFIDNKPIKLSVAINFPEGKGKHKDMMKLIHQAIVEGVNEIDYCINYKIFNTKPEKQEILFDKLIEELEVISNLCHKNSVILKIIIDINNLTLQQIKKLADILIQIGADYIQTSTANKTDIKKLKYLRSILPGNIKIKVAGEISTIDHVKSYNGYADRIGTSRIFI
jgi:deoxyribose-phosphate aldolase